MTISTPMTLGQLGWKHSFQQQLSLDELTECTPFRVTQQHRTHYLLIGEEGEHKLEMHHSLPPMTVGDWVLIDKQGHFVRCLERLSLIKRKAAGSKISEQFIAANIDTLFIVCALNEDFNLSRIERFIALAREAGPEPVVILSKADLCEDTLHYIQQVQSIDPFISVQAVNGLDAQAIDSVSPWCGEGKTIALTGSSGVGKSTLLNQLSQQEVQQTNDIRLDDGKGRHTTTSRSMHWVPDGTIVIDTPGMREVQIFDCTEGLEETFQDVITLIERCRFSDCQHESEPGCAVNKAIDNGTLSARRLSNYLKLEREQRRNSESIAEQRERHRQFGKHVKSTQAESRKRKKGY
ncbi:ribosome small subunit-dependent GTPase A [Vibrio sonorensis]|uniref:ribosome small subunit-dependent GTPase A n=1 Tax=Vibrio sonorensis TaxID=1004316 RepID=UPI0008D99875|nr:ribosome small subunit-dependent GTPase A [Vibrio sonorensis]